MDHHATPEEQKTKRAAPAPPRPAQRVFKLLRFLVGIGLLVWLFLEINPAQLGAEVRGAFGQPGWLLLGLLFTGLGLLTGVIRWQRILAAEGLGLPFKRVFQFAFIGQFFNAFAFGACGGDVARGYYIYRETAAGSRAEAGTTVIVDRGIGLVALLALCCGMIAWRLDLFTAQVQTRLPAILMVALLCGAILGGLVLLFFPPPMVREDAGEAETSVIRRSVRVLTRFLNRPKELTIALLLSLGNAVFLTFACWAFGRAILPELALADVFALFPVITVLASVPLTPGAIGIRENLFAVLFATVGVGEESAFAMSILVYLGGVFWSAVGGLCFLTYKRRTGDAGPTASG